MMKYKALAWDDEPDKYMAGLKARFESHHQVSVEIETERDEFFKRFENEEWDFVILDVIDKTAPENPQPAGLGLAQRIRERNQNIPIIFITGEASAVAQGHPVTGPVFPRSKSLSFGDMIMDILSFLKANVFDYTRVFLIHGRDRKAGNIRGSIKQKLETLGLTIVEISPEGSPSLLADELVSKMSPCGAFVALCTPDDKVNDGSTEWFQPRQNVILEIGIVMGLVHGLERLVILQRWGSQASEQARIPSDLEGKLSIRFNDDNNYEDALDRMVQALTAMSLRIDDSLQK